MATITGTNGADDLTAVHDQDIVQGLGGDDRLIGFDDSQTLQGGDGNDRIFGGTGDDRMFGDADDDTLFIDSGNDIMDGGTGFDAVSAARIVPDDAALDHPDLLHDLHYIEQTPRAGISLDLQTGLTFQMPSTTTASVSVGADGVALAGAEGGVSLGQKSFSRIEEFDFTDFSDFLRGNSANLVIDLAGGDDLLEAGSGAEAILGGAGFDWVSYENSTAAVSVALLGGSASGGFAQGDHLDGIEAVAGSNFNDVLQGGIGEDRLAGLEGSDTLVDFGGNDTLLGGAGNDTLVGGLGSDTLDGGADVDTASYVFGAHSVVVILGAGGAAGQARELTTDADPGLDPPASHIASIDSLFSIENVLGTDKDDVLVGNSGVNLLSGRGGNDLLVGGAGNDTLDGGAGTDRVDYSGSPSNEHVVVDLAAGTGAEFQLIQRGGRSVTARVAQDTLLGIENVTGTGGNDTLFGDAGDNLLQGGDGADVLRGGAGRDTLDGGANVDTADYSDKTAAVVVTLAGAAVAKVSVGGLVEDAIRNIENLVGGSAVDSLTGDDLDNSLTGGAGADKLRGGFGNDTYFVDHAGDQVFEGPSGGNDTVVTNVSYALLAGSEVETLKTAASAAADAIDLTGNELVQSITGNAGANTIDGKAGADTMSGLGGNDTYVVDDAGDTVIENAGGGFDTVDTTLNVFTLGANVERANFIGSGNFVGAGNALDNRFASGAGEDRFVTSAGADTYGGGGGTDSVDYRTATSGAALDFSTGIFAGEAAGDAFGSIEKFFGSDTAADTMTGGPAGRFKFFGFGGDDTLTGGGTIDQLSGGAGNDTLSGLAGSDSLDGGAGNDTMTGGTEADVFVYSAAGFGQDTITDFEDGLDKFKVDSSVATAISDYTITGNGSANVTLALIADPNQTIAVHGSGGSNLAITAADFVFY